MRDRGIGFVLAAVTVCSLAACGYGSNTASCVSWAGFPTLQDKYDAADLVVVASSAARDGTAPVFGVDAHAYDVRVDDVLKGDLDEPRVRISAMPDPCSGRAAYPEGDPLDTSEPLLVFATVQDGEWFTLTPTDGTAPFTKDALDSVVR